MQDHRKVEEIFKQFEQGIEVQEAQQLLTRLYKELSLHALSEENVFYPALAAYPDMSKQLKDAFKEHAEVKALFGELVSLDMTTSEWRDKMGILMRNVKQHVEEEERNVFPAARQFLNAEKLQRLADELNKAKQDSTQAVENSLPMKELQHTSSGMAYSAEPAMQASNKRSEKGWTSSEGGTELSSHGDKSGNQENKGRAGGETQSPATGSQSHSRTDGEHIV
jgi:hemerythrin superfamily protein